MYMPNSAWTWTFALVTLVQGLAVIGLEAYSFDLFETALNNPEAFDQTVTVPSLFGLKPVFRFVYTRTIPTFLALYIFAVIYQFILTIDALRLRNIIQIMGLCGLNILLMVYGAVQQVQAHDAIQQLQGPVGQPPGIDRTPDLYNALNPISIAVICVFGGGSVIMGFVAWKLYQEFAWTIYKSISADLRMKRRYLMYQVYIALLKFDFFFFLGYTIQWIVVLEALNDKDYEFPITIVAVPVTIIILLLAAMFARRESMAGTILVMVFYLVALAYFIFKLVRIWSGPTREYYQAVAKPMTTFAAIDIALILVTIGIGIKVALNFKMGLKDHLMGDNLRPKNEIEEGKPYHESELPNLQYPGAAPMPSRMTIE